MEIGLGHLATVPIAIKHEVRWRFSVWSRDGDMLATQVVLAWGGVSEGVEKSGSRTPEVHETHVVLEGAVQMGGPTVYCNRHREWINEMSRGNTLELVEVETCEMQRLLDRKTAFHISNFY